MTQTFSSRLVAPTEIAQRTALAVRAGGVAIFPTDTVYGIGCDAASEAAVERIFAAKRRPLYKPLSLHFAEVEELLAYATRTPLLERAARAFLPGPLTLIVARPASLGSFVTRGLETVGLRVPKHALCSAILRATGPLAATSANLSGNPAYTGTGLVAGLPDADVVVLDGPTQLRAESTVIDVTGPRPRLVREGAITLAMLGEILGTIEVPV
jgi:L-threonylcarbamoyladenylate synthase